MRKYTPAKGVKMSDAAIHLEMGRRVGFYLHQRYPKDGPKILAQEMDASPHTTRRWFEGLLPENKHLAVLYAKFGKPFVAFVMEPAVGPWPTYAMIDEIENMQTRLASMRADLEAEDARGNLEIARRRAAKVAGGGGVVPAHEEEAHPVAARGSR